MMNRKNIGELLLEYQLVRNNDLQDALEIQKKDGGRVGEILVKTGKVTEDDIQYLLSKQLNIPYVILEGLDLDESLLKKFDKNFLMENRILPIYETSEKIFIATDDPFNQSAFDILRGLTGKMIDISAASSSKIKRILSGIEKMSTSFVTFIDGIVEKISESPLYRIDFFYENGTLSVSGLGYNFLKELGIMKFESFDYKEILNYFGEKYLGIFYDLYENSSGFFMRSYPVTALSDGNIIVKFGCINAKGVTFSDMNYNGNLRVFKSIKPIDGYVFISFDSFIDKQNVVNIYDNLPMDKRDTDFVKVCDGCGGDGCNLCHNLGVAFSEVKNAQN